MYFAWLGLFLFTTNILHVISFCGVLYLWIYRFDDLRYGLVARVLQCFHAVHLLTPDSSLFLLRCLKWPTLSFARGGPCGGHWLGVSMTTWLFRWVCTDFLLLLLLNVSNLLSSEEHILLCCWMFPNPLLNNAPPLSLSRLDPLSLQPRSIMCTYSVLWGDVYVISNML